MTTRDFQIVVWGATGFTGSLVCEHLAESYKGKVRWAAAGRSLLKLQQLRHQLCAIDSDLKDLQLLTASLEDAAEMNELAGRTTVVLSAAGPFARIGTPLVDACVRRGTHYCDTTGEVLWVARMIDKHHAAAAATGTKIVHCCAYDSIPADLGTLLVVNHIRSTLQRPTARVQTVVGPSSGGASGGTLASALGMALEPQAEKEASVSPYFLCGCRSQQGADGPDYWGMRYNNVIKTWVQPFILQFCDRRIVHRSNSLLDSAYGENFCYEEAAAARNIASAAITVLGTFLLLWLMFCRSLHGLLLRLVPQPGTGPPPEQTKHGFWGHTMIAHPEAAPDEAPLPPVLARVGDDKRDAGYWGTSRMLLEAGLCLVQEVESGGRLPGTSVGGNLTPAAGCGTALIERLRAAGMRFEIVEK